MGKDIKKELGGGNWITLTTLCMNYMCGVYGNEFICNITFETQLDDE